jgi:hypothetical protein
MLLQESMKDLKPLLEEAFPDSWEEIYALATVRVIDRIPLERVGSAWDKIYNAEGINPNLHPTNLSTVLRDVRANRAGQDFVFKGLLGDSKQLVYDLSSMFSRSMSISQAEKGYNKDKIQVPQINLALLCVSKTKK